jgi:hypothetical protein
VVNRITAAQRRRLDEMMAGQPTLFDAAASFTVHALLEPSPGVFVACLALVVSAGEKTAVERLVEVFDLAENDRTVTIIQFWRNAPGAEVWTQVGGYPRPSNDEYIYE